MKSAILPLVCLVLFIEAQPLFGLVRYVNVNSANPSPPYTNWLLQPEPFKMQLTSQMQAT